MRFSSFRGRGNVLENNLAWRAQGFDPTFGDVAGVSVSNIWNAAGSLASAQDAEIIALTEGKDIPWYITPILGMRNLLAYAGDPKSHVKNGEFVGPREWFDENVYADLSKKMSNEEWENSEHYRPDVKYHKNMNLAYASVMAKRSDRERRYATIMSEASTGQVVGATLLSIAVGLFEPVNVATGFGIGSAASAGVRAAATTAFGRSAIVSQLSRGVARPVGEGLVGAGVIEVAAHKIAGITEEDYTLYDSFLNVGASVVLAGGIHGIGAAYGRYRNRSIERADQAQIMAMVNDSIVEGRDPIQALHLAGYAAAADEVPNFSTLTRSELQNPNVVKTKDGFEAKYPNEEGVVSGATGKGKTKESAIADLQSYYAADFGHGQSSNVSPEYMVAVRRIAEIEDNISNLSARINAEGVKRGIPLNEIEQANEAVSRAKAKAEQSIGTPQGKKASQELKEAKKSLDVLMKKHKDDLRSLSDEANNIAQGLSLERAKHSKFVVGEQQKNLAKMTESFYSPTRPNGLESTYKADPEIEGASARLNKVSDEITVNTLIKELDEDLLSLKEEGNLTADDIRAIDRIEAEFKEDFDINEAMIAGLKCLRG